MTAEDIERTFRTTYSLGKGYEGRFTLVDYALDTSAAEDADGKRVRQFTGKILDNGQPKSITGTGNGPISSLLDALSKHCNVNLAVKEYSEHAIGSGSDTKAAGYVELVEHNADPKASGVWGVGVDEDVTAASLKAVLSAASSASRTVDELEQQVDAAVKGGASEPNTFIGK